MNDTYNTRILVRGVIADVRAAIPGVTRDKSGPLLLDYLGPAATDPITWELDMAFGPPNGAEG